MTHRSALLSLPQLLVHLTTLLRWIVGGQIASDHKADIEKYGEEIKELRTLKRNVLQEVEEKTKENKELIRQMSQANMGVVELNHKVKGLERENKVLQTSFDKVKAQLEDQVRLKSERDIEIERLKLSQEEVKAQKAFANSAAKEETEEKAHRRKGELMTLQSNIRIAENEKKLDLKEKAKKKANEEQRERMSFASGFVRDTLSENNGSFRNLMNSNQVSQVEYPATL